MAEWDEQPLLSMTDDKLGELPAPATAHSSSYHKRRHSRKWLTLHSQPPTPLCYTVLAITLLLVFLLGRAIQRELWPTLKAVNPHSSKAGTYHNDSLTNHSKSLSHGGYTSTASSRAARVALLNADYNRFEDGFGVGSIDLKAYEDELHETVLNMFPRQSHDSTTESMTHRLDRLLECFLPGDQQGLIDTDGSISLAACSTTMSIPRDMYATAETVSPLPPALQLWSDLNPQSTMHALDDVQLDSWVSTHFAPQEREHDAGDVAETWWRLLPRETMPILKYDFWRLLVLALKGGTYTDADTTPLQPISAWPTGVVDLTPAGLEAQTLSEEDNDTGPSLVVGIEWTSDKLQRNKYNPLHDRRVGVVQWTFGAAPGHPVVVDAIKRVMDHSRRVLAERGGDREIQRMRGTVESRRAERPEAEGRRHNVKLDLSLEDESGNEKVLPFDPDEARAVLEWTGPAVLTDAVARYLRTLYATPLASVSQHPYPVRIGDVLILPLTALHARQSRWAQALDWALGRGWAPWTVLEGEKDGGGLMGLVGHEHAASWWKQKMDGRTDDERSK